MNNSALYSDDEIAELSRIHREILKPTSFKKEILEAASKKITQEDRDLVKKVGAYAMEKLNKRGPLITKF